MPETADDTRSQKTQREKTIHTSASSSIGTKEYLGNGAAGNTWAASKSLLADRHVVNKRLAANRQVGYADAPKKEMASGGQLIGVGVGSELMTTMQYCNQESEAVFA